MSDAADLSLDLVALDGRGASRDVPVSQRLAAVYELTKPRMNFLVLATTAIGFATAAAAWDFEVGLFLHVLLGTALSAAGASVLNQFLERDVDARMRRTRVRPLPAGVLPGWFAAGFGVVLSILGVAYLAAFGGGWPASLAAATIVSYVAIYTPMKRRTPWCTLVGAVPGALPPAIGVMAVSQDAWPLAVGLFGVLFAWQMPHFYGLAILYRDDYREGGLRMLPGERDGPRRAARQAMFFAATLLPLALVPTVSAGVGLIYGMGAIALGGWYLAAAVRLGRLPTRPVAKRLFVVSILYLPALLGLLVVDAWV